MKINRATRARQDANRHMFVFPENIYDCVILNFLFLSLQII